MPSKGTQPRHHNTWILDFWPPEPETKQPLLFRLLLGHFVMTSPQTDAHGDAAETQVHSSSFLCLNRSGSISCKIPHLYDGPQDSD